MAKEMNWVVIALLVVGGYYLYTNMTPTPTPNGCNPACGTGFTCVNNACVANGQNNCQYQPAYTYDGIDKFYNSVSVPQTDEIKLNGNAPQTSLANPTPGETLQYWASLGNATCPIVSTTSACGNNVIQAQCYYNSTSRVNVYDQDNKVFLTQLATSGNYTRSNSYTLGANSQANLQLTLQSESKRANYAEGGCLVIEYPTSISEIQLTGALSSAVACPYTLTYSSIGTSTTFRAISIPEGFDSDGSGVIKTSDMIVKSSSSDPSGLIYFTAYQVGNYIANDGTFAKGIEKDKNADSTKVSGRVFYTDVVIA